MAIGHTAAVTANGEGSSLTLPALTLVNDNRELLVAVSYTSTDGQQVDSVTFQGAALAQAQQCSLGPKDGSPAIHQEVWRLTNPQAGSGVVVVTFNESVKGVAAAVGFDGISQAEPMPFSNDGVGDGVQDMSLQEDVVAGDVEATAKCVGADTSEAVGGNEELWNVGYGSPVEFRSQGILITPGQAHTGPRQFSLDQAARWALNLLVLAPA